MKKTLIISILVLLGVSSIAQISSDRYQVHINGYVNVGINPIENIKVYMAIVGEESFYTTYTDTSGYYEFIREDLTVNEDTVVIIVAGKHTIFGIYIQKRTAIINSNIIQKDFVIAHNDPTSTCGAGFNYNYITDNTIQLINVSYDTDSTQYSWDFGDGYSSSEKNPIHTYYGNGDFPVTLEIEHNGCYDSYSDDIDIDHTIKYFGQVIFEGSHDIDFIVRLISKNNPKSQWYNGIVDKDGNFSFIEVPTDTYIIEAAPKDMFTYVYPKPIPTFYPNKLYWNEADTVQIAEETIIEINTSNFVHSGTNSINCHFNDLDNFMENKPTVILMNSDYEPLTVPIENDELNYSFIDIQAGTYLVYPQYAGKITVPYEITFENNDQTQMAEFDVSATHIAPPGLNINKLSSDLKIFPNPATDILHINTSTAISKYQIIDLSGKTVISSLAKNMETESINIKELKTGTYILKVYTKNEIGIQTFAKQ